MSVNAASPGASLVLSAKVFEMLVGKDPVLVLLFALRN